MRFLGILASIVAISMCYSASAQADPKPWIWGWWPSHWENLDFDRPYLDHPTQPHNHRWDTEEWTPEVWAQNIMRDMAPAGPDADYTYYYAGILDDFYVNGIITGHDETSDDIPVLEVGQPFINLSQQDRRRVVMLVDHVYQVTRRNKGMFYIHHEDTGKPIGIYTEHGLQMQ